MSSPSHHFLSHKKTLKEERWDREEVEGRIKKKVEVLPLLVLEKTGFTSAGWTPDNGRLNFMMKIAYELLHLLKGW